MMPDRYSKLAAWGPENPKYLFVFGAKLIKQTCISVFFGIDFPGQWGIFVCREAFWKRNGVFCGTGMATAGVGREFKSLVQ